MNILPLPKLKQPNDSPSKYSYHSSDRRVVSELHRMNHYSNFTISQLPLKRILWDVRKTESDVPKDGVLGIEYAVKVERRIDIRAALKIISHKSQPPSAKVSF